MTPYGRTGLTAVGTIAMGLGSHGQPASGAQERIPFDVAEVFFELNNTDGDLGIHALIDGEPWKRLAIRDPRGRGLLAVLLSGRLRRQGLTELFCESDEPSFDDLSQEAFFERFLEGTCQVSGVTLEGDRLILVRELSGNQTALESCFDVQ